MKVPYEKDLTRRRSRINMNHIISEAKKYKEPEPKLTQLNMQQYEYIYDMNAYLRKFLSLDLYTPQQLIDEMSRSYLFILDASDKVKDANDPNYNVLMTMFTNTRFIKALTDVIATFGLDEVRVRYLNRLIYNYLLVPVGKKDLNVENSLLSLGRMVNRPSLQMLLGSGLNELVAIKMVVCANSSDNIRICIKRVNCCIFNNARSISCLQNVVDIYQYLFNRYMTNLFETVMFDVYSRDDLSEADPSQVAVYEYMSSAILILVNTMPIRSIKTVLTSYAITCGFNRQNPVRFSLRNTGYARINEAIAEIEATDSVYIL